MVVVVAVVVFVVVVFVVVVVISWGYASILVRGDFCTHVAVATALI